MTGETASAEWQSGPPPRALLTRLRYLAIRDTNVVVASVVLTNLLRAVSSLVLTRLLVPEVFGISGVISAIQYIACQFTDLGFQAFVVRQANGDRRDFLDTVWTVGLIRSLMLAAILVVAALPLSHALGKPDLALLIAASSATLVIDALASTSLMSALRKGQILRLSSLEIGVMVVQIAVAAVLAWAWGSYWAILGGMVASSGLKAILSYALFPDSRRRLRIDRETLRELWAFARYITGSSILSLIVLQCDKLVLARVMTLERFGFYMLAVNLSTAAMGFAANYSGRVLYPYYSQLWRDGADHLRTLFYAKRRMPSLVYALALGGGVGGADFIIAVLYDPRYADAGEYLRILSLSSLILLSSNAANETLVATGRVWSTLEASFVRCAWFLLGGTCGYVLFGPIGLVWTVGLLEYPGLVLRWWRMGQAGLLDLGQELLVLAVGAVGIACGYGVHLLFLPMVH